MHVNRWSRCTVLLITLILLLFFASSIALGAPNFFPGEINENWLAPQEQSLLEDEEIQGAEAIEGDIPLLNGETAIQGEALPLEPIIIPAEPFMGGVLVPAEAEPELPQTGAGMLYMEAGYLLTIIGILILSQGDGSLTK